MKKTAFVLSWFLCLLGTTLAQNAMTNGRKAYGEAKFQEAIRFFDQAVRENPVNPEAYAYRGNAFFILGNYAAAEADFTRAIEQNFQQSQRAGQTGSYRQNNMVLIDPNPDQVSSGDYAMLYNNRGVARYFQGKVQDAVFDFNQALEWDRSLGEAMQNRQEAIVRGGTAVNPGQPGQPIIQPTQPNQRPGYVPQDYRYARPISVPQPVEATVLRENSEDIREDRLEIMDLGSSDGDSRGGISALFTPKPFEARRVTSRGKTYRSPEIAGKSHNYIRIDEVQITPEATFVTITVENREQKPYQVSIDGKNGEGAYYLTDRSGSGRRTFRLRNVTGIETYPRTSAIAPGASLTFKLEFGKIPDDMGYINLIEGTKQTGAEWNFYGVDLTR